MYTGAQMRPMRSRRVGVEHARLRRLDDTILTDGFIKEIEA